MKIHFDAKGKGCLIEGFAECGCQETVDIDGGAWEKLIPPKFITTDPTQVTCSRCKKTRAYRDCTVIDRAIKSNTKKGE